MTDHLREAFDVWQDIEEETVDDYIAALGEMSDLGYLLTEVEDGVVTYEQDDIEFQVHDWKTDPDIHVYRDGHRTY